MQFDNSNKEIILAKLTAPKLPPQYIARPRLYNAFLESLAWKIVVVSAPVGYGKSTLLAEWFVALGSEEDQTFQRAWLNLDAKDSDPRRLWMHLMAAMNQGFPDALSGCSLWDGDFSSGYNLAEISNRLFRFAQNSIQKQILFLDGLDSISTDQQRGLLNFAFEYLPNSACVVVSCSEFSRSLIDFRHIDRVYEFTLHELAYTREESRAFVQRNVGDAVSESMIECVCGMSQGWPTGLHLLVENLKRPGLSIEEENCSNMGEAPLIDSFFTSCVAEREPDEIVSFLIDTSMCARVCADLCNSITGRNDGQEILEHFCARNFFTAPDGNRKKWYIYQPLFRMWLRSRLMKYEPGYVQERIHRAGDWFEEHGAHSESARLMLMGSDTDFIENLAASTGFERDNRDESFLAWTFNLDSDRMANETLPSLFATWAYYFAGDARNVRFWLEAFKRTMVESAGSQVKSECERSASHMAELIRIKCNQYEGHYESALVELADYMRQHDDINLSLQCLFYHALGESCERVGDFKGAYANYLRSEAIAGTADSAFYKAFSRYSLGWLQALCGDLGRARETCMRALGECPFGYTLHAALHSLMAFIQVEMHQLGEAARNIEFACEQLSSVRNKDMLLEARAVRAKILAYSGEVDEAYREIVKAVTPFNSIGVPRGVLLLAYDVRIRIAIMRKDFDDAREMLAKLNVAMGDADLLYRLSGKVAMADLLIRENKNTEVVSVLEDAANQARECGLTRTLIEILADEAIARNNLGEKSTAFATAYEALRIGAPQQDAFPFVIRGADLSALLHEIASLRNSGSMERAFAKTILADYGETTGASAGTVTDAVTRAHLTKRETEVLVLLNAGMSRQEMAKTLGVSLNTVKTHVNNIYTKMGVENRTDAFAASQYLDR